MRQSTKSVIGVLSLGVLASSYSLGMAHANEGLASGLSASGTTPGSGSSSSSTPSTSSTDSTATGSASQSPSASSTASSSSSSSSKLSSSSSSSSSSSTANKATAKATATATPKATATSTPTTAKTATPTATPTPTKTTAPAASNQQTGDAISYKYGTFKIQVVKSGSNIASINVLTGTTRGGQYAAIIPELVAAAVSANGSNFGNYSGATFTTNAFKQALESALAKF